MTGLEFDVLVKPDVIGHLISRGVLGPDQPVAVTTLSGGVSSSTFLAETPQARYVVKQPLPYLSVADEWPSTVTRAAREAAAMRALGNMLPDRAPALADYDPGRFVITMAAAPRSWREWRTTLLGREVDPGIGRTLGEVLGTWHRRSQGDAELAREFGDLGVFMELRGDPYYRTVAARRPEHADTVLACLDELTSDVQCLVHGDFSPKNVLAGPGGADGLWVLDFEVAHWGNPVFDVAFLLHHLVMKAAHQPGDADRLQRCATEFLAGYRSAEGPAARGSALARHTGALLLARVHGKSPTAYLIAPDAKRIADLGGLAVEGQTGDVLEMIR
jgi:aminoglycoside phosphotransferase (APT) family kinase protein